MASPDRRSTCKFCQQIIEQNGNEPWTTGKLAGLSGRNRECASAPNPDEGPMPDHVPAVIAERPTQWPASGNSPAQQILPRIPWIPADVNRTR